MNITEIAAFGGLLLGLVNLYVLLYQEFFKKAKIQVLESELIIRQIDRTLYNFQIKFRLYANKDNIHIKRIQLANQTAFTGNVNENICAIDLNVALPFESFNIEKVDKNDFSNIVSQLGSNQKIDLVDLKIEKDAIRSLTCAGQLIGLRKTDGWEKIPTSGWSIKIRYNKRRLIKQLRNVNLINYL